MPMIEVVVSAAVGAVSGSALTVLATYVQMRLNRAEGIRTDTLRRVDQLWQALHEGQRELLDRRFQEGSASAIDDR
ncbi:hypothetical protein GCM10010270_23300 [Streptomyces violaceus]|nr:hypothetical protein GCM10010270_23300 [Streptomyces janthinus]